MGSDVTTFEVELEQEKAEKIAQVAARGAAIADELGQDPETVQKFLRHYFRHVDAVDVDERSVEDLLGLVESHYRLARAAAGRPARPSRSGRRAGHDGWTAGGASVVQIVTDDRPFLVDSVTMEVLRQGWSIREMFHPQYLVRRDLDGNLHGHRHRRRTRRARPDGAAGVLDAPGDARRRPPDGPSADELADELEPGLLEVLRLVEEAVEDWAAR